MTTSLPPTEALFHMTAKVFKRSEGRSAVAAAAYRSASRLHDARTGQVFDYRSKPVVMSLLACPPDAPEWVKDREMLWNRAEEAERRKDAVVARECEISIPRDISQDQWQAFAYAVAASYVEVGAIADIAIHCPADAYGEPQPHLHVMLTTRSLDASTASGFSAKKNDALAAIFESGGRRGGNRGEALKIERARVAAVMNEFLAAAGSGRRASHESNADRGIEREPEPTLGEKRMHAVKNRKRHDRKSALVSGMRNVKTIENLRDTIEEELMENFPKYQAFEEVRDGISPHKKQNFKASLLEKRFPGIGSKIGQFESQIHLVDIKNPFITKVAMRDGGWVEVQGNRIRRYGNPGGNAIGLTAIISDHVGADDIEFLEEQQSIQKKGSGIRQRRAATDPAPEVAMPQVESCADRWRSRGYFDITESPDGCWIAIGSCRIQDLGDELRIHGKCNDAAGRALLQKAIDEWGSEVEIYGSREFKDSIWREAQRSGVQVFDQATGQLYEPSADVRKAFEADRAKAAADVVDLADVKAAKAVATLVREAASGEVAALAKLEMNDPDLTDFVTLHLDDDQRAKLAGKPEGAIIDALPAFRELGKAAREADDAKGKSRATGPRPVTAPPEFLGQDNQSLEMQAEMARALAINADPEFADDGDVVDYTAEATKHAQQEADRKHDRKPS